MILKTALKNRLRNSKRVAILGIGSELRGDDSAGIFVAKQLEKEDRNINEGETLKVFLGGTAPENITGELKRFKPTHLIIVDSADMNEQAGEVKLINPEQADGFSFCTHNLPIKMLAEYLTESIGCEITIIGIQPKNLNFGSSLSEEVEKSAKSVSDTLKIILSGKNNRAYA